MRPLKQRILIFIAKFGGKLMFAALQLTGVEAMTVIDPTIPETLMEFPRQAWFRSGETNAKEDSRT